MADWQQILAREGSREVHELEMLDSACIFKKSPVRDVLSPDEEARGHALVKELACEAGGFPFASRKHLDQVLVVAPEVIDP